MTDTGQPHSSGDEGRGPEVARSIDLLLVTYILYFAGFITGGVGGLVGVIIAYLKRDEVAGSWRESHYIWLIRTFWIGLLYGLIGVLTLVILIGKLIIIATVVWLIIRLVKGWISYSNEQPIAYVDSWLVG